MSQTLSQNRAQELGHDFLPFGPLAAWGLAANVPGLAFFLLTRRLGAEFSLWAGSGVALAVYSSLHWFVRRGLEPFLGGIRGQAKPATGRATAWFALLLPLKYAALGGLMWLLWRSGHLSLVWFAVSFILTQVVITTGAVLHLARQARK